MKLMSMLVLKSSLSCMEFFLACNLSLSQIRVFVFGNMFNFNELTKIFPHSSQKKLMLPLTTSLKVELDPLEIELVMV